MTLDNIDDLLEKEYLAKAFGKNFKKKNIKSKIESEIAMSDRIEVDYIDLWINNYVQKISKANPGYNFDFDALIKPIVHA